MITSTKGLLALMNHEGVVLSSYRDPAGVWTIGVGHTAAAGPPRPRPGEIITLDQAIAEFRNDIKQYEAGLERAVKVPLKSHEFDALVSFHFNTGAIARAAVTRHLNSGDNKRAAAAFMNWTTAGGQRGVLADRRRAERALFAHANYGNLEAITVYDRFPGPARVMSTSAILDTEPAADQLTPPDPVTSPVLRPEPGTSVTTRWLSWLSGLFRRNRT